MKRLFLGALLVCAATYGSGCCCDWGKAEREAKARAVAEAEATRVEAEKQRVEAEKVRMVEAEKVRMVEAEKMRLEAEQRAYRQNEEDRRNQADLESKLSVFAKESAPDLHDAMQRLDESERLYSARIEELEKTLRQLRRPPDQDPQVKQWRQALDDTRKAIAKARLGLEDAYLAKKKYELSPSPEQERATKAATTGAAVEANATLQKYKRLTQSK